MIVRRIDARNRGPNFGPNSGRTSKITSTTKSTQKLPAKISMTARSGILLGQTCRRSDSSPFMAWPHCTNLRSSANERTTPSSAKVRIVKGSAALWTDPFLTNVFK